MLILSFLVQLAGATMLLLYAVRMVRTGIERAFGASFRRFVTEVRNPLGSAATGLVMAMVLQSSAAVALLASGFAEAGILTFASGLAVVLGGDLGSALLIQVLSFRLDWLVPLLLAVGGAFFIRSDSRKLKQAGRIILGIAFILISLRFLRETMEPIRDSTFLPAIAGYLATDFFAAFLIGAALAWLMHSSVAVILMCVTLVSIHTIPVAAGGSLVLGANLGSALIPVWLGRGLSPAARRIPLMNMLVRGSGALLVLLVVNKFDLMPVLSFGAPAQTLINLHLAFNALLLVALPFCGALEKPARRLLPDRHDDAEDQPAEFVSVLDPASHKTPQLALANLRREVLRMEQIAESMVAPAMRLFDEFDRDRATAIVERDEMLNTALDEVRRFVADLPSEGMTKRDFKNNREMTEYAIALETVGDLVSKSLVPLARRKSQSGLKFSKAGRSELENMHERVIANMALASNVLVSDDLESARLLLEEKGEMTRLERASRKKHLRRLSDGSQTSFESSDIHLEVLRVLREINSLVASVCYPILYQGGQLLETRLIETMKDEEKHDIAN